MKYLKIILFFLFTTLFFHFSAQAADCPSPEEIEGNPARYVLAASRGEVNGYFDKESIESIRYAPPHYTIKVNFYYVDKRAGAIHQMRTLLDYNWKRSEETLVKEAAGGKKTALFDTDEKKKQLMKDTLSLVEEDTGMQLAVTDITSYSLQGEKIRDYHFDTPKARKIALSEIYTLADVIFYHCHHTFFGVTQWFVKMDHLKALTDDFGNIDTSNVPYNVPVRTGT